MSLTTSAYFSQIVPVSRATSVGEAQRAEVRDPLWFLARQWQLGEYNGENAASPAFVHARVATWTPSVPLGASPEIELQVGRSAFALDLATRLAIGTYLLDLLVDMAADDVAKIRAAWKLDPSQFPDDADTLAVVVDDALDGGECFDLAAANQLRETLSTASQSRFVAAIKQVRDFLVDCYGSAVKPTPAPSGWDPTRLAPQLSIPVAVPAADGTQAQVMVSLASSLDAVDWFSFDAASGGAAQGTVAVADSYVTPAPLTFPGMPANRYWAFEEGTVNYLDMPLDDTDLARTVVIDFMNAAGTDWLLVPVQIARGSVARVVALEVVDTFGETFALKAFNGASPGFQLFALAGSGAAPDALWIPATAASPMTGDIVEQVRFARDEFANLGWAMVETLPDSFGSGCATGATRVVAPPALPANSYRLSSGVPPHWFPCTPLGTFDASETFTVGLVVGETMNLDGTFSKPEGDLLASARTAGYQLIRDNVIPRSGLRLFRRRIRARTANGRALVWENWLTAGGAGELSSRLRFDQIGPRK